MEQINLSTLIYHSQCTLYFCVYMYMNKGIKIPYFYTRKSLLDVMMWNHVFYLLKLNIFEGICLNNMSPKTSKTFRICKKQQLTNIFASFFLPFEAEMNCKVYLFLLKLMKRLKEPSILNRSLIFHGSISDQMPAWKVTILKIK